MSKYITESEMMFFVPNEDRLFYIEASNLYKAIGNKIRTTEFIYLTDKGHLRFIEAKKSCPNVNNKDSSDEKRKKYEVYYASLTQKFMDSLMILTAAFMGRRDISEFGSVLQKARHWQNLQLRFLLVIKDAEEVWLGGVKAELEARLFDLRKIWRIEIQVLNKDMAVQKGIVR